MTDRSLNGATVIMSMFEFLIDITNSHNLQSEMVMSAGLGKQPLLDLNAALQS